MVTFWEIAARSVSKLFSLYFVYLLYLFISRFDFKSGICLLIDSVPVHCYSITFLINHDGILAQFMRFKPNVADPAEQSLRYRICFVAVSLQRR